MADPIQSILSAIQRVNAGIAILWCGDYGLRDWYIGEVESLIDESTHPLKTSSVAEALAAPQRLVLLCPENEREVVLELDGSRDQVLDPKSPRTQPIVLFLLRNGDGEQALAGEAFSLASWVTGASPDPEKIAEIDRPNEREAFLADTGKTPERWLEEWHAAGATGPMRSVALSYRASLLVSR